MGTYVHRIHKSTLRTVRHNGEETAIAASKFAYKPGSPVGRFWGNSAAAKRERAQDMTDQRVANAWDETNFPKLVAFGGYEDGNTVYSGFSHNQAVFYDTLTEREHIRVEGFVKMVGRRVTVVSEYITQPREGFTRNEKGQRVKLRYRERYTARDGKFSSSRIVLEEEVLPEHPALVAA